jgi:hypothetical protein
MAKQMVAVRLEPDLLVWITRYAAAYGWDRTQLITELLVALREGRVDVRSRSGSNAFPVHEVQAGSTPECPIYITYGLK